MSKLSYLLIGFMTVGLAGGLMGWATGNKVAEFVLFPEQAYVVPDLNRDEERDLIIELRSGYKIPRYGVRDGKEIRYVPASEIMKINPDTTIDYGEIERELNK